MSLRILHTADLHLGSSFRGLGKLGKQLRKAQSKTLSNIINLAKEYSVDIILIAGDLFDSNQISRDLLHFTLEQIKQANPIPVFLMPGNHDYLDEDSIYNDRIFQDAPNNLHLFNEIGYNHYTLSKFSLTVYAKPITAKISDENPLAGLEVKTNSKYQIALAHGSLSEIARNDGAYLFSYEDIIKSNMNYIALGHWHSYFECSIGKKGEKVKTKAIYSGAPLGTKFAEHDAGNVLLVDIKDDETIQIKKIKSAPYYWYEKELDITGKENLMQFLTPLYNEGNKHKLLRLKLTGLIKPTQKLILKKQEEYLNENWFYAEIKDNTHLALENLILSEDEKYTLRGQFLTLMQKKLSEETEEKEKKKIETALQIGLALLEGNKL